MEIVTVICVCLWYSFPLYAQYTGSFFLCFYIGAPICNYTVIYLIKKGSGELGLTKRRYQIFGVNGGGVLNC